MTIPTIAVTVDCLCATQGKCFVSKIVSVAEQHNIPLTWLLGVAEHDPLSNVKLYHNEYFHRIPSWHEIGLTIAFDKGAGNEVSRGDLIRIGKDVLKQYSIKPTAFRAANGDLEPGDFHHLEDIGILVDSTPGSSALPPASTPKSPYHPSYEGVHESGNAAIWVAPVAHAFGVPANLDIGFDKVKSILDAQLETASTLVLTMSDTADNAESLKSTVDYLKTKGARFVTMTQLVSEL